MKEKLEQIFNIISAIPVSGESVDRMAAARTLLRECYKEAEEQEAKHGAAESTL